MLNQGREQWKARVGFVLAAAGSAIGLGNIWRFPYVMGEQGGAAFLIIYIIAVILIGYPAMVTEISLGRATQKNPVGAFKAIAPNTPWWLVGAMGVLTGFIILSYYSVVAGWSLSYIIKAITGFPSDPGVAAELFGGHIAGVAEPVIAHLIFMAITIGVIAAGVVKGIQRVVTILMPVLLVLLLIVIVRAVTLEGAGEGLTFMFTPDFGAITGDTFLSAIGQAFFTLSLGMGAILTYGSYLSSQDDIRRSSVEIISADTILAVLAGIAIFPAVFAIGLDPGEGPGLIFVTLPAVFAEMPLGSFFGFIFFLLLSIAALTSAISLLEVVTAYFIDEKGWSRKKASVLMGGIIFLVGIPSALHAGVLEGVSLAGMSVFDLFDFVADSVMLPLGGALTVIFASYVWGMKNLSEEANKGSVKEKLGWWMVPFLKFIIPAASIGVMVIGIWETFTG